MSDNTATDAQIKHMVSRFLGWRLPENFNPDGGISFKAAFNEHTAYPMKHEPSGTNLLDGTQATVMVRHMVEGMPSAPPPELTHEQTRQFADATGYTMEEAFDTYELIREILSHPAPVPTCKACGGNDAGTPCAYPSDGVDGCLRDKRLYRASPSATRQR